MFSSRSEFDKVFLYIDKRAPHVLWLYSFSLSLPSFFRLNSFASISFGFQSITDFILKLWLHIFFFMFVKITFFVEQKKIKTFDSMNILFFVSHRWGVRVRVRFNLILVLVLVFVAVTISINCVEERSIFHSLIATFICMNKSRQSNWKLNIEQNQNEMRTSKTCETCTHKGKWATEQHNFVLWFFI